MPLLKRKIFQKANVPDMLRDSDEVFYCEQTKEIFKSYDEYFERVMLTSSIIWQCELTGRPNLTYEEALDSEKAARKMLRDYPRAARGPVIFIASLTKRSALSELIDDVYNYVKDHYFKNEEVDVLKESGKGCRLCEITEVINPNMKKDSKSPTKSPGKTPDPLKIQYKVKAIDDKLQPQTWTVKGEFVRRDKSIFTKDRTKLFLKQHVELVKGMLKIKDESFKKFVTDQNITANDVFIGKVPDFELSKTLLKVQEKKNEKSKDNKSKKKDGDNKDKKSSTPSQKKKNTSTSKQGDITKYLNSSGPSKVEKKQDTAEEKKKKEENAKKLKEDMERLRKENAEREAERKKKLDEEKAQLLAKTQATLREANQVRDDLELTDHRKIPMGKPVMSMIGEKFFGDFVQILEFLHSFPEIMSIKDKFPQGVTMDLLERALIMKEINGPLSDILQVLLSTIFSLQIEEENEIEIQYRVNGDNGGVSSRHPKIEAMQNASRVQRWSNRHYCTKINELVMDSMTISELLRLHFLSSGAILADKCARFRFQQRGGYQSTDDPALGFCNKYPHILRALKQYTIFDLPMADIIKVIKCLIEQILTYSSVRELIEDRLEASSKAKFEYKMIKAAERKRELKVNEEKRNLREELKQKIIAFEGTPEAKEAFVKESDKELEEKLSKIEIRSQSEKEKYLKDLKTCAEKFFDYQNFLGTDRGFRSYYVFESLPGLFVEHDITFAGKCLDELVKNNPGLAKCTNDQRYAFIKQMVLSESKSEDKENKTNNAKEAAPKVNGTVQQDPVKKDGIEFEGVTLSQKDLLMCSADPTNCIIHTPDHPDRVVWSYYNTEEEITELIKSLNVRGFREKSLRENLDSEKELIFAYIKDCPVEKLTILPEQKDDKMKEIVKKYLKKYDYANLNLEPGTDPTTIYDLALRENILDFEQKITLGCLGGIKVSDRIEWRKLIENFDYNKLTENLVWGTARKMNGMMNGHAKDEENGVESGAEAEEQLEEVEEEEEEDGDIEELDPGLDLGNTTTLESEDSSDEGISLHDSETLRNKVQSLASALLQIEQGIDVKFIRAPFGPKKDLKDKNAQAKAVFHCKKKLQRWENSLMRSSNLSQIFLHYNILHDSISWSKSAIKQGCMVCRRKSDPEQTLLCDECNKAWHMYCLKPKLKTIPEGEWFCPKCRPEDYKVKKTTRKRKLFIEEEEDADESLDDTLNETIDSEDAEVCTVCDFEGKLAHCISCEMQCHAECAKPVMKKLIKKNWICWKCKGEKDEKKAPGRKKRRVVEPEVAEVEEEQNGTEEDEDEVVVPIKIRKSKGRPKKVVEVEELQNETFDEDENDEVVPIKIRKSKGRPKKSIVESDDEVLVSKKPGRKSKRSMEFDDEDDEPIRKKIKEDRRSSRRQSDENEQDEDSKKTSRRSSKKSLEDNKRSSSRRATLEIQFDSVNLYSLLDEITKHKHSWPFNRPVSMKEVPDYYEVVKNPMDFAKIKSKLNMGSYTSNAMMMKDVELVFFNCDLYNTSDTEIYQAGVKLEKFVKKRCKELELPYNPSDLCSN